MNPDRQKEIDLNYDFFLRNLGALLVDHEGEFALIRNREVIGFYNEIGAAFRDGLNKFEDRMFSVQKVTREPVELGNMSIALA